MQNYAKYMKRDRAALRTKSQGGGTKCTLSATKSDGNPFERRRYGKVLIKYQKVEIKPLTRDIYQCDSADCIC